MYGILFTNIYHKDQLNVRNIPYMEHLGYLLHIIQNTSSATNYVELLESAKTPP